MSSFNCEEGKRVLWDDLIWVKTLPSSGNELGHNFELVSFDFNVVFVTNLIGVSPDVILD